MQALDVQWDKGALMLEEVLLKKEQVDCPVVHRFGPGIYIREVSIPAGVVAIGHHQNFEHVNIMLKGRVKMLHADGKTEILQAPFFSIGEPGRKVGYIIEDMVWQNVYATELTDVEELEAYYLTKSPVFREEITGIDELDLTVDREDFLVACADLGISPWLVRKVSERDSDMISMPSGYSVQVGPSHLEGKGLHATAPFNIGDVIAPARLAGKRTIAGRYTNHAKTPNATAVLYDNGDISFVAIQEINGNKGGQLGDEITVDYRQVYNINEVSQCQV